MVLILISLSCSRTGNPVVRIPLLRGSWEGKLNRFYNMSLSNLQETPLQDFVLNQVKIHIYPKKDGLIIKSLVNASFTNTLPISISAQKVDVHFWIFYNKFPLAKFEFFGGDFGMALEKDKNLLFTNSSVVIVDPKRMIELVMDWLHMPDSKSAPIIEAKNIILNGYDWSFLQSIISGLSFSFQLPKAEMLSQPFNASLFNASMRNVKCSAKTVGGVQVNISGIVNYENPFEFSIGPDPIWLSMDAYIFFKGSPVLQIISTDRIPFKIISGKNEQVLGISAIVTNETLAMELFSRYAEGQDSQIEIGRMRIQNVKDSNWYWMNGMLDSVVLPFTVPGANEDGENPIDCDISSIFSA